MFIQGVGWQPRQPRQRVRRQVGADATLLFETEGPHVAYALGISAKREIAVAIRLLERRIPIDAAELADTGKPLAALLRAKV